MTHFSRCTCVMFSPTLFLSMESPASSRASPMHLCAARRATEDCVVIIKLHLYTTGSHQANQACELEGRERRKVGDHVCNRSQWMQHCHEPPRIVEHNGEHPLDAHTHTSIVILPHPPSRPHSSEWLSTPSGCNHNK